MALVQNSRWQSLLKSAREMPQTWPSMKATQFRVRTGWADTVRELATILNPQNEARPTALLGAGASLFVRGAARRRER
jgi:hypothetical protein